MVGMGGHRGGGHHSHSHASSSSSSSRGGGYYNRGAGWGPSYYYSTPSYYNSGYYDNSSGIDQRPQPQSAAASILYCGCCLVTISTVILLIIVSSYSSPKQLVLDPGDTLMYKFGSQLFNSGLHIVDHSAQVSVYYLDQEPTLDKTPSGKPILHDETITLDGGDFVHFTYFLNKGSTVNLQFKVSAGSAHFFLIAGEENFNKWSDDPSSSSNKIILSKYSSNSQPSSSDTVITTSDTHYLVFDNDKDYSSCSLSIFFSIGRTQYSDLGQYAPVCSPITSTPCDIDIGLFEKRKVVFGSPGLLTQNATTDTSKPDTTFSVDVYTLPRWSGIAFFWLLMPSMFLFACFVLPAFVIYMKGSREGHPTQVEGVNTAVFANSTPVPVGTNADPNHDQSLPGIELLTVSGVLAVAEVVPPQASSVTPWANVSEFEEGRDRREDSPLMGGPSPSAPPIYKE